MANFTTHIAAGTIVSGALATLTLAADVVAPENLVAVTMVGVLGSVLPDIDLKESRPSRAMFAGLGVFFSFVVLFAFALDYSISELWLLWLGTLVGVRYGLHAAFHRLAVHRGIWHSLLACLFASVLTAIFFSKLLHRPDGVAWLAAGFMAVGFLVHLALDEIYSVDVMDTRIKSSFGTAIKLIDRRHPFATGAMLAATAAALYLSPPTKMFVDGISSQSMWAGLQHRLLPADKWFGLVALRKAGPASTLPPAASPITTGSLPGQAQPVPGAQAGKADGAPGPVVTTVPDAPQAGAQR